MLAQSCGFLVRLEKIRDCHKRRHADRHCAGIWLICCCPFPACRLVVRSELLRVPVPEKGRRHVESVTFSAAVDCPVFFHSFQYPFFEAFALVGARFIAPALRYLDTPVSRRRKNQSRSAAGMLFAQTCGFLVRLEKIRDCHKRRAGRRVESMMFSAAVDCPSTFSQLPGPVF